MPNYKGHVAGGVIAYGVTLAALHNMGPTGIMAAEWLLCALAGALFPDIDIWSKGRKYFYYLATVIVGWAIYQHHFELLAAMSIFCIFPNLIRHRGITHQLWFVIAFPLVVWVGIHLYFPHASKEAWLDMIFFVAGAVSHLLLDLGLRKTVGV